MCSTRPSAEIAVREALAAYPDDPGAVANDRLEDGFAELQRLGQAVEAKRLRWLAEVERRRSYRRDGYLSTHAWLTDRFRLSGSRAKEQVRTAKALEEMPLVRTALSEGHVPPSAVPVLVQARESHPEAFAGSEDKLLKAATQSPAGELRRLVQEWSYGLQPDGAQGEAERLRERRGLDVSPTWDGMVRMQGELDPEGGEQVLTALQAMVDADVRSGGGRDPRTPAQRRADAMVELARQYLDAPDRPAVAGERPHLTVTVGLEVLRGLRDGSGDLDHVGSAPAETARRTSCDATVRRVVLDPASEPLDVGRRTPVIPPGMRRAVVLRDRACRFPGCTRPHPWCDAHHIRHWAHGGHTGMDNLILLCRAHHRLVHEGGFRLEMIDGRPFFRRPDGSVLGSALEDRAPP